MSAPEVDAAIRLVAEAAWAEGYLAALDDIPWDDTTPNPYKDQS